MSILVLYISPDLLRRSTQPVFKKDSASASKSLYFEKSARNIIQTYPTGSAFIAGQVDAGVALNQMESKHYPVLF